MFLFVFHYKGMFQSQTQSTGMLSLNQGPSSLSSVSDCDHWKMLKEKVEEIESMP